MSTTTRASFTDLGFTGPSGAGCAVTDAVVSEPESPVVVEHEIVRRSQRPSIAFAVELCDCSVGEIDTLDSSADVRGRIVRTWQQHSAEIDGRETAAVVAQVERAVRTDGSAVWTSGNIGDRLLRAIRRDTGEPRPEHFDQDHRAVGHSDRPFGKAQS